MILLSMIFHTIMAKRSNETEFIKSVKFKILTHWSFEEKFAKSLPSGFDKREGFRKLFLTLGYVVSRV